MFLQTNFIPLSCNFKSSKINNTDENKPFLNQIDESLFESRTMEKLYSPECYTPQKLNKDGYWETTVISKKTGKPVKAFVKKYNSRDSKYEHWRIYTKRGKQYSLIGGRSFIIDKAKNVIQPSTMASTGNDKYSGIGLRCHQIAVERMMQENFDTVNICSTSNAFPFHYKSGFRAIERKCPISNEELKTYKKCLKDIGLTNPEIKEELHIQKGYGLNYIPAKNEEHVRKLLFSKNGKYSKLGCLAMSLQGEFLSMWEKFVMLQPIMFKKGGK